LAGQPVGEDARDLDRAGLAAPAKNVRHDVIRADGAR
jgi:hypothetical protein